VTERLGILGGTFDPVHVGHLLAALEARHQLGLDRVLLVVAAEPWQKEGHVIAAAADRFDMVAAAVDEIDGLDPSRIEIDRGGPTYTVDTVETLSKPGREIVLIVGEDVAARIDGWHRGADLRELVSLAVVGRGAGAEPPVGWSTAGVTMPRLDVSSSDIRARIGRGAPIDALVPPGAVRILAARRLYTPA